MKLVEMSLDGLLAELESMSTGVIGLLQTVSSDD